MEELEAFKLDLQRRIESGELDQATADDLLLTFLVDQNSTPSTMVQNAPSFLETLTNPQAFLQNPISSAPNDELANVLASGTTGPETTAEIEAELAARQELLDGNLAENITNPLFWERGARAVGKGPSQMINGLVQGLPGIIASSVGAEETGERWLNNFMQGNQNINNTFGSSDPVTPLESLGESAMGALVPGGLLMKATGVGTDFMVDQTIRELTDTEDTEYNTVMDSLGLTNDSETPTLGPLAAIAGTMVVGGLATSAVTRFVTAKQSMPISRPIIEIDPAGPPDLNTIERASDLTRANLLDEQNALRIMIERAGVPNFDDISERIEFDTHTAARTRVQEGLRTGTLHTKDADFNVPVAPRTLYDGYRNLEPTVRKDVGDYINLHDMLDDARLALSQNLPGNHQQTIASLRQQIAGIAARNPLAVQFHRDYKAVTSGVRGFLENGLFSQTFRQRLDIERPNYVPLEISPVRRTDPFLQRMSQAQVDEVGDVGTDWFLQRRDSIGNYDMARRPDPMDMLMEYTEAALLSRMKNDTRVAIVDQLMQSTGGANTMRRVTADEAEKFGDRLVRLYRNGERETYITSRLQADLMKFDPYIAQYPAMFAIKRIAENAMVGPLSITFAPTTMIRDTIGGMVTRPDELASPTIMGAVSAVPKQMWARAQDSIARSWEAKLMSGSTPLPEWVMSRPAQQRFAQQMSNSYLNTIYHAMNTQGGFDASLMTNKVRAGTETLKELRRTIEDSAFVNNPLVTNVVSQFGVNTLRNSLDGFIALFNSIQDAPRFAAIERTIRQGGDVDSSVRLGRQLTGDVSKSGRVYSPMGQRMRGDAVDQGFLNVLNKPLGQGIEVVRETTPFFNPMVQGLSRLTRSFADDPIGTNLRAWKNVGLPALAAYGWNEMLGKEYNDYAMDRRAARDVAMTMYIGLPGLPPEQGLEIPIMHELLFYAAPFTRSLHGITRGEDADLTSNAMANLSSTMLSNSLDVGFPVAGALMMNMTGNQAPDSLLRPTQGTYSIREDNVGFLPQNMEAMARTLFASTADTALELAYGMTHEGDYAFGDFMETARNRVLNGAALVKNFAGRKAANTAFSLPAEYRADRMNAYQQARDLWDEFYNPKRLSEGGFDMPSSSGNYMSNNYEGEQEINDLPYRMVGPERIAEPTNPMIERFGATLASYMGTNAVGMTGMRNRESQYSKYTAQLRRYGPAERIELEQWQERLNTQEDLSGDDALLRDLLQEHEIDLTEYTDRIKLINLIEIERSKVIKAQLDIVQQVEDIITEELIMEGVLAPDQSFDVTKHLRPYEENPFE